MWLFIPIFFVVTGIQFDLASLIAHPSSLLLVPICIYGYFVRQTNPVDQLEEVIHH
jgi:Kef-type K+ transport system membrane component KefB